MSEFCRLTLLTLNHFFYNARRAASHNSTELLLTQRNLRKYWKQIKRVCVFFELKSQNQITHFRGAEEEGQQS